MTPKELFDEVAKDKAFFDASGGGVTLSGGEPLLQRPELLLEFLSLCRQAHIRTLVETAGGVPWEAIERVIPYTDQFYFDLKAAGEADYERLVGFSESVIHKNIQRLLERDGIDVAFRMVIVPGYNSQCVPKLVEVLQGFGIPEVTLLRYNTLGNAKLDRIKTQQVPLKVSEDDCVKELEQATKLFESAGIRVNRYDSRAAHVRRIPTARVQHLKEAVRQAPFSACLRRSILLTEYYQQPKTKDADEDDEMMMRAKAFAHVMDKWTPVIFDNEWIVGNYTAHRVGGHVYMEIHGIVNLDIAFLDRRKVNPLFVSRSDKVAFYTKLLPYWLTRCSTTRAGGLKGLVRSFKENLLGSTFVTPVGASVAHFIPNFKRLLELGTSGIIAEAKGRGDSPFQRSIEIELKGLEAMAAHYAEAARQAATTTTNKIRAQELMDIAAVCDRVPKHPAQTFHEALQALFFGIVAVTFEVQEQGLSFGRLDQILWPYYQKDLEAPPNNSGESI